jgi:hypothetical protein
LDADDLYHAACVAAAERLPSGPLLTIWVCFTEAMYLLGAVGGLLTDRRWKLSHDGTSTTGNNTTA